MAAGTPAADGDARGGPGAVTRADVAFLSMKGALLQAATDWQLRPALADVARAAEDGGCDQLTVMDHWFQLGNFGGPQESMLEGYTTLDVLSGGRAQLGIGAAWYEREHLGLGVPFPPLFERFERLEETLQICRQMWSDNDGPFLGEQYHLAETICIPQPLHRIPILIGGNGEGKTLRLVARYGDACNLFAIAPQEMAHKIDVLRRHCQTEGRDPAEVRIMAISGADPVADTAGFLDLMSPTPNWVWTRSRSHRAALTLPAGSAQLHDSYPAQ
ncbi:MAG: LLM class flavin-dependent oxidoreductase [Candidatus Nanopelagicales bacterium]|nr:LLM class flavin-dependent oxidoreductase [Candidatus Nanopelagicales bacterium]